MRSSVPAFAANLNVDHQQHRVTPHWSFEAAFTDEGSPVGTTLIGRLFDEGTLCRIGNAMKKPNLNVARTRPELFS